MSDQMQTTKVSTLAATTLIAGLLGWGLLRVVYGDLPPLRWYMPVWIALLAVGEFFAARQFKRRINRAPGTTPVEPLLAARAVVLAKASSVLGAILLGVWLGFVTFTGPNIGDVTAAAADFWVAWIGVACAGVLVGAALLLEHACKTPRRNDADNDPPGAVRS